MKATSMLQTIGRAQLKQLTQLLPPGVLGRYIFVVGTLGTAIIAYAVTHVSMDRLDILLALFLLSFMTEWAPVRLLGTPLQGSSLSVSAAAAFAALLIFGPVGSILTNLGSALAYNLREPRPFYKRFLTSGALVISSAVAALVYWLAGGSSPILFEGRMLIAAGLAAVAYFATNASLISAAISLATQRPFRGVLSNWQWLFLQMLSSLAIGLIMALVGTHGWASPGFLLIGTLLVLPWYSVRVYVQKSRQVAEQNDQLQKANTELALANRSLDRQLQSLRALHNIGISLNSAPSVQIIFSEILNSVVGLIAADACAIFLYDQNKTSPSIAGQIGLSAAYLERPEMALDGSAVRALQEKRILIMDSHNAVPEMLSVAAINDGIRTAACLPLNVAGELVGGLDVCFKSEHTFTADEIDLLKTLGEQAAVAIHNARLVEQIHETYLSTIRALAAAVEAKDPYTRGHSEVVRRLAISTGRELGLSVREIELLNLSALFHDIGKIGIPESILNKPAALDDEELATMRHHPVIGEQILSKVPALSEVPSIVRHHHERCDRTGYPDGIPARDDLLAAIISVCDAYQAMTSDRPYRKALPQTVALEELRLGSGTQFVPEVVSAFLAALEYQDVRPARIYRFEPALLLHNRILTENVGWEERHA